MHSGVDLIPVEESPAGRVPVEPFSWPTNTSKRIDCGLEMKTKGNSQFDVISVWGDAGLHDGGRSLNLRTL